MYLEGPKPKIKPLPSTFRQKNWGTEIFEFRPNLCLWQLFKEGNQGILADFAKSAKSCARNGQIENFKRLTSFTGNGEVNHSGLKKCYLWPEFMKKVTWSLAKKAQISGFI